MNKENHGIRAYNSNDNNAARKREMFQRIDEKDGIKGKTDYLLERYTFKWK